MILNWVSRLITHLAAMERRRNITVHAQQSDALDELFRSKADKFTYHNGVYTLHFTNPTSVKAVQGWSDCMDVEALTKRKRKEEQSIVKQPKKLETTTDAIYHSVLQAKRDYEDMITKGKLIDTVLKKHGISEEVLQPQHTRPLKLYRSNEKKKEKHKQEIEKEVEKVEKLKRRIQPKDIFSEETRQIPVIETVVPVPMKIDSAINSIFES